MCKGQEARTLFVQGLGYVTHLRFWRSDFSKTPMSWEDLREAKKVLGYGDRAAIEIYPSEEEVVNEENIRHLWVLPEGYPLPSLYRRS